jgi:hypothetical protein
MRSSTTPSDDATVAAAQAATGADSTCAATTRSGGIETVELWFRRS